MITGGCGGIGLVLAEYLARAVGARLLLTGRTPLPPRAEWQAHIDHGGNERLAQQLRTLMRLEASGAEVLDGGGRRNRSRAMRAAVRPRAIAGAASTASSMRRAWPAAGSSS